MSKSSLRFLQLVASLAAGFWILSMVGVYMFGSHGLPLSSYISQSFWAGVATLFGFLLVFWAIHTALRRLELSASESLFTLAAPLGTEFSPLESELIGFLNARAHWPAHPSHGTTLLREQALRRWRMMRGLPDTTHLHGALALASALGPFLAFTENRTPAPWWKPDRRDDVTFTQVAEPSGTLAASVLIRLPAFQSLALSEQESLVLALRHIDTPPPEDPPALVTDLMTTFTLVMSHAG